MSGILYGVGVGPGESELLTLKGLHYIKDSDVILLPAKDALSCRAYQIVAQSFPEIDKKQMEFVPFPLTSDEAELEAFHIRLKEKIESWLDANKYVAFLTIGDPSIYSNYSHLAELVEGDGYPTQTICGIPSFIAAAAALNIDLGQKREPIHIIPNGGSLRNSLMLPGTKIFMKSGKRLQELKQALLPMEQAGRIEVCGVSSCGLPEQKLYHSAEDIAEDMGYLTLIIARDIKRDDPV